MSSLSRALLCASVFMIPSLAAAQSRASTCAMRGPNQIPARAEGGLATGPHTFIADGVRFWYCVAGRGAAGVAPVVFLHGGPGQGSDPVAALAGKPMENGLRMVWYDQRGSGRSERPFSQDYRLGRLVEDIEALRVALGVPRISLMAHSFGGALALEYAAAHPEHVARIVMVDAISDIPASSAGWCARLAVYDSAAYTRATAGHTDGSCNVGAGLEGKNMQRFFDANMFPDPMVGLRVDSVEAAGNLQNTGEPGRALFGKGRLGEWRFTQWSRVTMPVLVIAGDHDFQIGPDVQRAMVRALPHATLTFYEGAGHFPMVEQPDRFGRDVTAFLTAR